MLSPLDDYPIHQIAEPMRHVGTSDRNFYDRYYFNLHRCDGELFAVFGLGQYPNLGVADAFVAVTGVTPSTSCGLPSSSAPTASVTAAGPLRSRCSKACGGWLPLRRPPTRPSTWTCGGDRSRPTSSPATATAAAPG